MCQSGIGTRLIFGTSGFAAKIESLSFRVSREILECTNMDSAVSTTFPGIIFREFEPGDLAELEEFDCDLQFDMDLIPPINAVPETITIQGRPKAGQTTGASIAFTGFMTSYGADIPFDGKMTGSYTIRPSGEPTWTPGA